VTIRFHLSKGTGDVPPVVAARRMGLSLPEFLRALSDGTPEAPSLLDRGFPPPDPTTGNFDLDAIDAWRKSRYPQLYRLTQEPAARNARDVVSERIARLTGG
jgi:hypothetical protein